MTNTAAPLDPFAPVDQGIDEPDPIRAALRAAGPVVRVEAPAGGPVWIVTDDAVARAVLTDPRVVFGLIFPGQLTTDPALGFVLADLLTSAEGDLDDLVREALRRHPPAPFSLWRFTTEEVELAGATLPARSPLLIDILGIGTDPERRPGPDLAFGAGPHNCMGVQLAALELRAVAEVVRADFPGARLAVPRAALRQTGPGGIGGSRLVALPVDLRGNKSELGGTAAVLDPSVTPPVHHRLASRRR